MATRRMVLAALLGAALASPAKAERKRRAVVRDDGALIIGGGIVRLHGIRFPNTGRTCTTVVSPPSCGSAAVLALKDRLRGFVRCEPVRRNADRSVSAVCFVDGIGSILEPDVDLAAYLLERGYAVAAPDAPFDYVTLERIARAQGRGIWSDAIRWRR